MHQEIWTNGWQAGAPPVSELELTRFERHGDAVRGSRAERSFQVSTADIPGALRIDHREPDRERSRSATALTRGGANHG
jgi:hypothetical protein